MTLDLNDRSVSRFEDRPLHKQLADVIREQIRCGALRPGDPLPSEGEIERRVAVSRTTVREALDVLIAEGLAVKRSGAPTRVTTPPPVRHVSTSRYRDELEILRKLNGGEHPLTSAFVQDHDVAWDDHRVEATYIEDDAATATDAEQLAIAEGSPVLRRQLVKIVAGEVVQLQESVLPAALAAGTPVADPSRQPWPGGTVAELFSIGMIVTKVTEEASARTPTTAERRQLVMEAAGPILEVTRTFYADIDGVEGPVETSTVIVPAARMRLRFETDLRT